MMVHLPEALDREGGVEPRGLGSAEDRTRTRDDRECLMVHDWTPTFSPRLDIP